MTTTKDQPEVGQPIDVTKAIRTAKAYIQQLYQSEQIDNLLLEEVEHSFNGWYITFGFDRQVHVQPKDALAAFAESVTPGGRNMITERVYKRIMVDETGTPLGMTIRKP